MTGGARRLVLHFLVVQLLKGIQDSRFLLLDFLVDFLHLVLYLSFDFFGLLLLLVDVCDFLLNCRHLLIQLINFLDEKDCVRTRMLVRNRARAASKGANSK